jgi:hypothetical protein
MTKSSSRSASRLTKAGIAVGGFTSLLLAGTAVPALAAVAGTLSVTSGPSGGGNTVTMTANNAFTTAAPAVEFQAVTATSTGCSTAYKAAANVTAGTTTPFTSTAGVVTLPIAPTALAPTRLTTSKIVIPIPTGTTQPAVALVGSQTTAKFYVCVYDGTGSSSTLLSSATYTIAAQPTLALQSATPPGVSPVSGPALGGNTVTITGTGFINGATTVTIGGTPATGVTVNAAGTSITATAPSHAPGSAQNIVVGTTGGSVSSSTILPGGYTFSNGINVTPNTSPTNTTPTLDITGAGFGSLTWATDLDTTGISAPANGASTGARVVLTDNTWGATNAGSSSTGFGAVASTSGVGVTVGGSLFPSTTVYPTAQCGGILPISDGEIICTLDLGQAITYNSGTKYGITATTPVPNGTYQVRVINSDAAFSLLSYLNNFSITSSGSTFTVSPY